MEEPTIETIIARAELRRTAELYAQGADRRDKDLWIEIMTADCRLQGPGFDLPGRDAVLSSLDALAAMYSMTQHRIHNQTVRISGDRAEGETYGSALHIADSEGGKEIVDWAIRYQDQWRREGGIWRFCSRTLVLDWEERRKIG